MTDSKPSPVPISSLSDPLASTLSSLCSEYRDLLDQIKVLEEAKKLLMETSIRPLIDEHGLSSGVEGDNWILTKQSGGRTDISPEKLLSKGVDMKTIEYATVKRTWDFYVVREKK